MQKFILGVVCLFILLGVTGCETCKGAGRGLKKDMDNMYENAEEKDDWFQENYW